MSKGLLIIDIQNDYLPGGQMELVGSAEAAARAGQVLAHFRAQGLPIFHVQHVSVRPGSTFFLPDTPGVEIAKCVTPLPGEPVIVKYYPNSFRETDLLTKLGESGVDELTVCGMMTHMCVDTGVRAAFDLGFKIDLVADACATRDLTWNGLTVPAAQVQAAYMAALGMVFARVVQSSDIL